MTKIEIRKMAGDISHAGLLRGVKEREKPKIGRRRENGNVQKLLGDVKAEQKGEDRTVSKRAMSEYFRHKVEVSCRSRAHRRGYAISERHKSAT